MSPKQENITVDTNTSRSRVYLRGNTFPIKDKIKAIGGHWDPDEKAWWVGAAKLSAAQDLAAAPTPEPATVAKGKCRVCGAACDPKYDTCFQHKPAPKQCTVCGHKPDPRDRYDKIYKSGECRDCFEERKMGY